MKNKKTTDIFFYIVLFAAWALPGFKATIHFETVIMFSVFCATLFSFFLIKNQTLKTVLMAVITMVVSVYNYQYILIYIPVLLLIGMSFSLSKKEKSKMFETCNTVYITLTAFRIFYAVFLFSTADSIVSGRWKFYLKFSLIIITFFIILLVKSFEGKKEIKKKELNRARVVYAFSIAGLIIDTAIYTAQYGSGKLQAAQFAFMHWFVLVLCVLYFKDSILKMLLDDLNNKLMLFLGFGRQSK